MKTILGRNVNDLYQLGLQHLVAYGQPSTSRAGDVVVSPSPVVSVYGCPTERVLFDGKRNANPFFHLMEGLWMLTGRCDSAFLDHYISDFGKRFAEHADVPGAHAYIHGAYGARWRQDFGYDQLDFIVNKLRDNPADRQCVIAMWDANSENWEGHEDLRGDWRDRPCNTHVYLRVRDVRVDLTEGIDRRVLDLTVCCRSNDIIMGAYGANAVHFSMLHEYLAGRIGVGVGTMYQFSNNYHAYARDLDRVGEAPITTDDCPYENAEVHAVAMADNWDRFDEDLKVFMEWHDKKLWSLGQSQSSAYVPEFHNDWFRTTACRVAMSNYWRIQKRLGDAMYFANMVIAPDWRLACQEWIKRRMEKNVDR